MTAFHLLDGPGLDVPSRSRWHRCLEVLRSARGPVLLVSLVLLARTLVPVDGWLARVLDGSSLPAGWAVLGVAAAVVFCLPGSLLAVACGLEFGGALGFAVMWTGALLGAITSFWLASWIPGERARWSKVAKMLDGGGWRLLALLRLTPLVPFFVLNYAAGRARFSSMAFIVGTGLAIVPGVAVYVLLGASATASATAGATASAADAQWPSGRWALWALGLVATLVLGSWALRTWRQLERNGSGVTLED